MTGDYCWYLVTN